MRWFAEHWSGETIDRGIEALWVALANFSPPRQKDVILAAVAETTKAATAAAAKAAEILKKGELTEATIKRIEQMADEVVKDSVATLSVSPSGASQD